MLTTKDKLILDRACETLTEFFQQLPTGVDPESWAWHVLSKVGKGVDLTTCDIGFNIYQTNPKTSSVQLFRSNCKDGCVVWEFSDSLRECYNQLVAEKGKGKEYKVGWVEIPINPLANRIGSGRFSKDVAQLRQIWQEVVRIRDIWLAPIECVDYVMAATKAFIVDFAEQVCRVKEGNRVVYEIRTLPTDEARRFFKEQRKANKR